MGSEIQENLSLDYQSMMYQGVVYPPFIKAEALTELRGKHILRYSDIVIATFPKCGTTWMQQIVLTLLADGDGSKVRRPMDMSPWLEARVSDKGLEAFDAWHPEQTGWNGLNISLESDWCPPRRVLKTHAPAQLAPWAGGTNSLAMNGARVIVVMRNPKDAAVSHYHHTIDLPHIFKYNGSWDHFLRKIWILGKVESGSFWDWHKSWWQVYQLGSVDLLWISYEELLSESEKSISRVTKFIGLEPTTELTKGVLTASNFQAMKQTFDEEDAKKLTNGQEDRIKKNHIRQGKSGSWTETFTKTQNELMDRYHMGECSRLSLPPKLLPQMSL